MEKSRRTFLKDSGLAIAGAMAIPYIIQSCNPKRSPNDRVNLGFWALEGRGATAATVYSH